ncbi:MAG: 3-phosphoshikimate 1-carboxyvinyltransferase, partial [Kangiellaceae bacterium]
MTKRLILPFNSNQTDLAFNGNKELSIQLPGSKYIANRLLPLCALATSQSMLKNVVDNDDILAATEGLTALGYHLDKSATALKITPRLANGSRHINHSIIEFNTHHSGTFSRFVTAIAALESIPIKINCSEKMATRPMQELFDALRDLGVKIESPNDRLPAIITGPLVDNRCQLDASRSSQYLSALLIIAPLLKDGLKIELIGKQVSNAYVEMTIDLMKRMNVNVERAGNEIMVAAGQSYRGIEFEVPGDPVSSSYFMGLAAISGQTIRIDAFDHSSLQGESKFYKVLEKMGVKFKKDQSSLTIISDGELNGIEVDMGEMPDVVQTLAVV